MRGRLTALLLAAAGALSLCLPSAAQNAGAADASPRTPEEAADTEVPPENAKDAQKLADRTGKTRPSPIGGKVNPKAGEADVTAVTTVSAEDLAAENRRRPRQNPQKLLRTGITLYDRGEYKEALELFDRLAQAGMKEAQYRIGLAYAAGNGVRLDYETAMKWHKLAANKGYPPAQHALGSMYYAGQGTDINYEEALKWERKAAEKKYAPAEYLLGCMYENGEGVVRDAYAAADWYKLAVVQNHIDAKYALAVLYAEGKGVQKDPVKAFQLFLSAAGKGHKDAAYQTGLAYQTGKGTAIDQKAAFDWYSKAAERGHMKAIYNMGTMYANAEGVRRELDKAYFYFILAKGLGLPNAEQAILMTERKLRPEAAERQVALARKELARIRKVNGLDGKGKTISIQQDEGEEEEQPAAEQ